MAVLAAAFQSYEAVGNREDLSDLIWDITPMDTPFVSMVAKVKATHVKHEWQNDRLAAASAANAALEGDEASTDAVTATVRPFNYCQIMDKVNQVSGTQEAITHAGRASEVDYQKARRMRELKRDMEAALTAGTVVPTGPGDDTTVRRLGSVIQWIRQNDVTVGTSPVFTAGTPTTARVDGTQRAFTEDLFKQALRGAWTDGGKPTKVILGPFNKQIFSSFSGGTTRFDVAEDSVLNASVDVYRSDFGVMSIIPSRFSRDRDCLILDPELWAVAELRPMFSQELAISGDYRRFQILWEGTLESRHERASEGGNAMVCDLTTS